LTFFESVRLLRMYKDQYPVSSSFSTISLNPKVGIFTEIERVEQQLAALLTKVDVLSERLVPAKKLEAIFQESLAMPKDSSASNMRNLICEISNGLSNLDLKIENLINSLDF
jgi:hypothetical protein